MTDTHAPDHDADPLAFLATLRPDAQSDAGWDHATSTAVLDRILETPRDRAAVTVRERRPAHRGRWAVAGLVAAGAAAAAVVGLVLPAGTPGGPDPAAAAELRRLAVVAGQQGGTVAPGQYAYTALAEEQTVEDPAMPLPAPGYTRVNGVDHRPRSDVWLSPSGVRYGKTGSEMCLRRSTSTDGTAETGNYDSLSGARLAALPTDPVRLAAFFDAHPSGDNRGTRNRFVSAADLVRSGLASPQLRAAALRVLAVSDGVTVRTGGRDDRNRPATIATFREGDDAEMVYFDPTTSAVLEEYQTIGPTGHYAGIVLTSGVVDRLPDLPRCTAD